MKIKYGKGPTKFGPGIDIFLTSEEVATAIMTYLTIRDVHISGPRTIKINDELCRVGYIYVDPSGFVICNAKDISERIHLSGRGPNSGKEEE